MRKFIVPMITGMCLLFASAGALAADKSTPEQATALVKKAVAYLKENGKDKAIAEFNNPKGMFVDRDLYIFVIDQAGVTLANGSNAKLIGKNVLDMRDQDNIYFVKKFIELGNTSGKGWVDYRWVNPLTNKLDMKTTYIEKADNLIIGCGIYK
jgi:cytochrome c